MNKCGIEMDFSYLSDSLYEDKALRFHCELEVSHKGEHFCSFKSHSNGKVIVIWEFEAQEEPVKSINVN